MSTQLFLTMIGGDWDDEDHNKPYAEPIEAHTWDDAEAILEAMKRKSMCHPKTVIIGIRHKELEIENAIEEPKPPTNRASKAESN